MVFFYAENVWKTEVKVLEKTINISNLFFFQFILPIQHYASYVFILGSKIDLLKVKADVDVVSFKIGVFKLYLHTIYFTWHHLWGCFVEVQ